MQVLCYRCGSYTSDGSRQCTVCQQPFASGRATAGTTAKRTHAPYAAGSMLTARYRVGEALARGAAGWLVRARDLQAERDVVIKVVAANLLQTNEDRER